MVSQSYKLGRVLLPDPNKEGKVIGLNICSSDIQPSSSVGQTLGCKSRCFDWNF